MTILTAEAETYLKNWQAYLVKCDGPRYYTLLNRDGSLGDSLDENSHQKMNETG